MIDTLLTSLFVGKRRGQVIEYGIHTMPIASHRPPMANVAIEGETPFKRAIKKGRQSFQTDALLPKTAATYSPTVAQYHRRDEA